MGAVARNALQGLPGPPGVPHRAVAMMAAPPPPPPPSPPVKIRTKFPESWIFTSFESGTNFAHSSQPSVFKATSTHPYFFSDFWLIVLVILEDSVAFAESIDAEASSVMLDSEIPPQDTAPVIRSKFPECWLFVVQNTRQVLLGPSVVTAMVLWSFYSVIN
ncbi:hypothetical protein Y032_0258g450 [Ancylostoma ceylanicum]|nr:hypothetical protein Y032_0258g450 [Ancylostoma ceylanicum]